jgi:hypothetical protein
MTMWVGPNGPRSVLGARQAEIFQALELNPKDQRAIGIVAQMDKLFEIDRNAREQGLSREDRHALRLEKAQPLLEEIKSQIEGGALGRTAKSVLAKACNYTLTLWTRLAKTGFGLSFKAQNGQQKDSAFAKGPPSRTAKIHDVSWRFCFMADEMHRWY